MPRPCASTPPTPPPAPSEWTHPNHKDAPDDGWSVETAGAILSPKGARLGSLTPEQLDIIIERGKGKMQSASVYLRAYLKVREDLQTLPERMTPEEIPMGGINADAPF